MVIYFINFLTKSFHTIKMKSISFDGKQSGDGECFRWEVHPEVRSAIIGKEAYDEELVENKEMAEELGHPNPDPPGYIYPGDVLRAVGCQNDKKYRFTITAEEIHEKA